MSGPASEHATAYVDAAKAVRVALALVLRETRPRRAAKALKALRDDMAMTLPRDLGPGVVPIRDNRDPGQIAFARVLISAADALLSSVGDRP